MEQRVLLSKNAQKELKRIQTQDRIRIMLAIQSLAVDPLRGKSLQGPLKGYFSLRVWPYRVIYMFDKKEQCIVVHKVGQREGVYG